MPTDTSTEVRDGVTIETVRTTDSDGELLSEVITTYRGVLFVSTSGAEIVNKLEITIKRPTFCNRRVLTESTREWARVPTYTFPDANPSQATTVFTKLVLIRDETVTYKWSSYGRGVLLARETRALKYDAEIVESPLGSGRFNWYYSNFTAEPILETWEQSMGANKWRYTRKTFRLPERVTRFDVNGDFDTAGIYRRAEVSTFSEETDKPPPVSDCLVIASDDDEEDLGPDPCFDPFQDVPCDEAIHRTTQQRLEDMRTLSGGRGVPLTIVSEATQTITSPLLSAHYPGEVDRIVNLALAAKARADEVLAGPTATLTESQPYLEGVPWAIDVVSVSLTAGEKEGVTVERRIYGSGPVTS
jgi:hypothetical protein